MNREIVGLLRQIGTRDPQVWTALQQREQAFGRRLLPDFVPLTGGEFPSVSTVELSHRVRAKLKGIESKDLAAATRFAVRPAPDWNSIALFFNLVPARRPADYVSTDAADAREWLDEGAAPAGMKVSDFMQDYWRTASYGHLNFGVSTPRDTSGAPLVPEVDADPQDWGEIARLCIETNAQACWVAAGSNLTSDGTRFIPSVVVVQHYATHASAGFDGWTQTVAGVDYVIGDCFHLDYSLELAVHDGRATGGRGMWGIMAHEYAHNFLQFPDLYGPQGCTGYWDLLGCNLGPTIMSEISSEFKAMAGWLSFREVIEGPRVAQRSMSLRPYTTSGDAYKVVPDPMHTPGEYFLLEYRASTGTEMWRPDGGLPEEGLLITHINTRVGVSHSWTLRDAPYFDPELADLSDRGAARWDGADKVRGVVFPRLGRDGFTGSTSPNSDLYGGRASGLSITNIRVAGRQVHFDLEIAGTPRVGWTTGSNDRALVGRFTSQAAQGGDEIVLRNDDQLALATELEAQVVIRHRQDDRVGDWNLGSDNWEVVGDYDGDGHDEVFIRSPEWAGILKWNGTAFATVAMHHDWIDDWNLGADDHELSGDFDGDGRHEVLVRSPEWIGVLELSGSVLRCRSVQRDRVDDWNLGGDQSELIGRFTRADREEVLLRSPESLAVLGWDDAQTRLRAMSIQHDWVDEWNLGGGDVMTAADLDGDGLDEIYIRSPRWVGVLKWRNGGFRVVWMAEGQVPGLDSAWRALELLPGDVSDAGRFHRDRDGILHRGADGRVAILTMEEAGLRMRHFWDGTVDGWPVRTTDNVAVGVFQRRGTDVSMPELDFVSDVSASAFIHNAGGTAVLGVNDFVAVDGAALSQAALTWRSGPSLMFTTRQLLIDPTLPVGAISDVKISAQDGPPLPGA